MVICVSKEHGHTMANTRENCRYALQSERRAVVRNDLKLTEIAQRIDAHLERFEADPKINEFDEKYRVHRYYHAGARRSGRYVSVCYISYQGTSQLARDEALNYLAWLDAGNVGTHYQADKEAR